MLFNPQPIYSKFRGGVIESICVVSSTVWQKIKVRCWFESFYFNGTQPFRNHKGSGQITNTFVSNLKRSVDFFRVR